MSRIRRRASASVGVRPHPSACVRIRRHASASVGVRPHRVTGRCHGTPVPPPRHLSTHGRPSRATTRARSCHVSATRTARQCRRRASGGNGSYCRALPEARRPTRIIENHRESSRTIENHPEFSLACECMPGLTARTAGRCQRSRIIENALVQHPEHSRSTPIMSARIGAGQPRLLSSESAHPSLLIQVSSSESNVHMPVDWGASAAGRRPV
jgi:hypothetical protein